MFLGHFALQSHPRLFAGFVLHLQIFLLLLQLFDELQLLVLLVVHLIQAQFERFEFAVEQLLPALAFHARDFFVGGRFRRRRTILGIDRERLRTEMSTTYILLRQPDRFEIEPKHFLLDVQLLHFLAHADDLLFELFAQRVVLRFEFAQFQPVLLTLFHLGLDDVLFFDDLHRQFIDARLLLIELLLEGQNRLTQLLEMLEILQLLGIDR